MKKYKRTTCAVMAILTQGVTFAGQYDVPEGLFSTEFSAEDVEYIRAFFPEYGGVHESFVSSGTDPNLHFTDSGELTVTFIDEGAGYLNSFGYFTFDENNNILTEDTLFQNASAAGAGGILTPGDSLVIGDFDSGDHVGFWLQANGYWNPNGNTYYTLDEYNPDGLRHMAILADESNDRLIVGIEDLYNLGDQDYNDIIFTFSVTPYSAVVTDNMPTGNPEPGVVGTTLAVLFGVALVLRSRAVRDGWGPHENNE
jgi:hypothetical protein